MELANIFYVVGIIYFLAWIAIIVFIGVLGWKTYQFIIRAPQEIQDRIEAKVKSLMPTNKTQVMGIAGTVGSIAMPFILARVKNMFRRRSSR